MILGETPTAASTAATLDDLFRRAGVRHPDALALADPPNRQNFTDGIPRALSFAQADRAISAIAARLRGLGLQTDSAVAIQLPNIVESIVAFLGVLRAGMDANPLVSNGDVGQARINPSACVVVVHSTFFEMHDTLHDGKRVECADQNIPSISGRPAIVLILELLDISGGRQPSKTGVL